MGKQASGRSLTQLPSFVQFGRLVRGRPDFRNLLDGDV